VNTLGMPCPLSSCCPARCCARSPAAGGPCLSPAWALRPAGVGGSRQGPLPQIGVYAGGPSDQEGV
jgi:hypothetical protein